jgi:hypothetical protein
MSGTIPKDASLECINEREDSKKPISSARMSREIHINVNFECNNEQQYK